MSAATAQVRVGAVAPPFTLADQFGNQITLRFPQKTAVLLVFADRNGRSAARQWLQAVAELPAAPRFVSVACTGWVPALFQPSVRRAFEQSKPILIDWNDTVAKQYGFGGSGFRLIVINPSGRITAIEEGEYSAARFTTLSHLLR